MYDLIIIGAGWAGFNACILAKAKNLKVALIEQSQIGGTCLNKGCIPTKALIQSAKVFSLCKKSRNFGIDNSGLPAINLSLIQERKNRIIQSLRQSLDFSLKGVDLFLGVQAKIINPTTVKTGDKTLEAKFILICTGSKISELPGLKFDTAKIISSDDALNMQVLPKSILIVGGGVIGCEFACLFANLDIQVSIVEILPRLLNNLDSEISKKIEVLFKKKGIKVLTNTDYAGLDLNPYDKILVSAGRKPNIDNLGLEDIGLKLEKGAIVVDKNLKTNIDNIYAAGDCTLKIMLAHFAAYQGRLAVKNMLKDTGNLPQQKDNIPNCIFTDPEIATVGLSEDQARQNNLKIKIHRFDFLGNGMARVMEETDGFLKIVSDADSGQILGAAIIGPKATELISILTVAVDAKLKVEQFKNFVFPHPTLSEAVIDALNKNSV